MGGWFDSQREEGPAGVKMSDSKGGRCRILSAVAAGVLQWTICILAQNIAEENHTELKVSAGNHDPRSRPTSRENPFFLFNGMGQS